CSVRGTWPPDTGPDSGARRMDRPAPPRRMGQVRSWVAYDGAKLYKKTEVQCALACMGRPREMRSIDMCVRLGVALLAGCAFATAALADEAPLSAIRAGHLVDVTNGKVVADQVILVRGERIEGVGAQDAVAIPSEAKG